MQAKPFGLFNWITKEIRFRKLSFVVPLLAIAAAATMLFVSEAYLQIDRLETDQILERIESEGSESIRIEEERVAKAGEALQDTVRKQMLKLGFNILILPEEADTNELHLNGSVSATMPYSYAERLANSNIVTVNHLLPTITKRIHWPEGNTDIVVIGTRGEIPIMHKALKQPMLDAIGAGEIVIGAGIQSKLDLKKDGTLRMLGRDFVISKIQPERGSIDDVTVWIGLDTAQEMFGMQNLIHAILALECECTGDRITEVRREISQILPGTKVIERYSQALTRAEARKEAQRSAESSLQMLKQEHSILVEREKKQRQQIEDQDLRFRSQWTPVAILLTSCIVGALAFHNVRQRRSEIGLMRAIGMRSGQILVVFLGKAIVIGIAGSILGIVVGVIFLWLRFKTGPQLVELWELFQLPSVQVSMLIIPVLMTILALLASWLAAFDAIRQDAAKVLQYD